MKVLIEGKLASLMMVLLFMLLSLSFVSCGGSDGDTDGDTDGDQVIDGDTDGDQIVDGDEDDADGDADGDTACTCDTDDDCCDGCNPINESGSCDDGNACTQTDTCKMGVCEGSNPVVCEAVDQCHDAGECDTETGECSEPEKEDGTACDDENACTQTDTCVEGVCEGTNPVICEALDECHEVGECSPDSGNCSNPVAADGTLCTGFGSQFGSGVCLEGECNGLNECVLRDWDQPVDYPCNSNSDCESGLCIKIPAGLKNISLSGLSFCSMNCDIELDDCPAGMDCVVGYEAGYGTICIPEDSTLPADGSQGLYEPCNYNEDCETGLCWSYNDNKICTTPCYEELKVEDNCGDCGICEDELMVKADSKRPYLCLPDYMQEIGSLCVEDNDCVGDAVCHENMCLEFCNIKKVEDPCPADYSCRMTDKIVAGEYGYLCVPDEKIGYVPENGSCTQQYNCEEDTYCDTYPTVPIAMTIMGANYSFYALDFIVGKNPSELPPMEVVLPDDGYYIFYLFNQFDAYSEAMYYSIEVTDENAVSPELVMDTELNDDPFEGYQDINIPAIINGTLGLNDIDVYRFEGTKGQVVSFTVNRREGSEICLPKSGFGEECSNNIECDGNLCHNGQCNKTCIGSSCPAGYQCGTDENITIGYPAFFAKAGISGYPICRLEEDINKSYAAECSSDYECESGYCLLGRCSDECSGSKAIDCGEGDMVCREASEIMSDYVKATIYMCLDIGVLEKNFGDECEYDLQCKSGLCYHGMCNYEGCALPIKDKFAPECPSGYSCIDVGSYNTKVSHYTCVADEQIDKAFGDACDYDYECESDFCNFGQCNEMCGDDKVEVCPENTKCLDMFGEYACYPNTYATGTFGDKCDWDYDCESLFCYKNECNLHCDMIVKAECPTDYSCVMVPDMDIMSKVDPYMPACLPSESVGKSFGEACSEDYECASGICHLDYCSEYCDILKAPGCPEGSSCQRRYLISGGLKASDYICKID